VSEQTLRNWVRQGDIDVDAGRAGLTSDKREELRGCGARTAACSRSARF
jgi:hypothetical protein